MKNVLIYYRYFGLTLGGGEYLPLRFIAALQKSCAVTLALDWTDHFERAVQLMGIPIDMDRLEVVQVMPKGFHSTTNNLFQSLQRFRRLRRLAKNADVCISLANIVDFGKPAHHFLITTDLGDDGFADFVRCRGMSRPSFPMQVRRFVKDGLLRPLLGMRSKKSIITDPREHLYPNSEYADALMRGYYGTFNSHVFYPPTLFVHAATDMTRDPLRILYIGRVSPAKRISDIVEIAAMARTLSGKNLRLSIAGRLDSASYRKQLENMTVGCDWIDFPGELFSDAKARFLASGTYAIHAMRTEAFGISVTEYLKSGLIPIVPDEGGAHEVVSDAELSFGSKEDAAKILARLVTDDEFRESKRSSCRKRAEEFSMEAYERRERELLDAIVAG